MAKEEPAGKKITINPQQLISLYKNQQGLTESLLKQEAMTKRVFEETLGAEQALKEIDAMDKKANILCLLGAGISIEAEVKTKTVKAEVGGGIVQDFPVKKALKQLADRKKKIIENLNNLEKKKREARIGLARLEQMMRAMQKAMADKKSNSMSVS